MGFERCSLQELDFSASQDQKTIKAAMWWTVRASRLYAMVLAFGLLFSSLLNFHQNPHTVFQSEWLMLFAVVVAAILRVCVRVEEGVVRLGALPLVASLLLMLCLVRMPIASGMGYPLYLLLLLAVYCFGQQIGRDEAGNWIAGGLLLCAVFQSLAGLAQLEDWTLGGMVMQKLYLQAFGNIGQANHYTDLIFLGLASLCHLYGVMGVRAVLRLAFLALAAWLCLAGAASASRGAWLYTLAFLVLGIWGVWRARDAQVRAVAVALLAVAGLSVLAQILVSYCDLLSAFDVTSSIARASDAGSNGQRLYDWQAAWLAIQSKPWWGEGPASFYKLSIDAMPQTGPTGFSKFAEHAHNLPLQIAAEFGVPAAILSIGGMMAWYGRHLFRAPSVMSLWVLACIAVLGLHSMVEYPLWYTYFLVPMGLCCGMLDWQDRDLPALRFPSWLSWLATAMGVVAAVWIMSDWVAVRSAYVLLNAEEPTISEKTSAQATAVLDRVNRYSVFALVAEDLRLQAWTPEKGGAEEISQRCERAWPYKPAWYMMMHCGEAYAVSGYSVALEHLVATLCEGFPKHHQALREWAKEFDASRVASVKISGRGCLKDPSTP